MNPYTDGVLLADRYRTIPFEDAAAQRGGNSWSGKAATSSPSHASIGFAHHVPATLLHIGCMWLADGDEKGRCGATPTWTMGSAFDAPRLYCEHHAQQILSRRLRERQTQRQRRERNQSQMSTS
jgi:hypothetical protein